MLAIYSPFPAYTPSWGGHSYINDIFVCVFHTHLSRWEWELNKATFSLGGATPSPICLASGSCVLFCLPLIRAPPGLHLSSPHSSVSRHRPAVSPLIISVTLLWALSGSIKTMKLHPASVAPVLKPSMTHYCLRHQVQIHEGLPWSDCCFFCSLFTMTSLLQHSAPLMFTLYLYSHALGNLLSLDHKLLEYKDCVLLIPDFQHQTQGLPHCEHLMNLSRGQICVYGIASLTWS